LPTGKRGKLAGPMDLNDRTMFYPEIEPYAVHWLDVDHGHRIFVEESGNPKGKPVIFLHGGPGGGSQAAHRRHFDPVAYRIILFDQRGCGRSTPFASLTANTTWDLVGDIERIRLHLGLERWMVFGGSWGSTLALAYAAKHPDRITEIVLRGIFLLRQKELRWFYQEGAEFIYPDAWETYVNAIPEAERGDLISAYYKRLTDPDPAVRLAAARAWAGWEGSTLSLYPDPGRAQRFTGDAFAEAFARIECHYFVNKGFFAHDGWLLDQVPRFRHIPAVIVQGRYDVVTPALSAWDLKRAWPEADLVIVPDAGHAATEPGIARGLLAATDRFKNR